VIDAETSAPKIAQETIERVRALYAVEKPAKDVSMEERLNLHQEQSTPMLAELRDRLLGWRKQLLPKNPMARWWTTLWASGLSLTRSARMALCLSIKTSASER